LNNPAKAVLGLDEQYHFLKWYANTQDSNLKEFSFDGTKFNYNSSAFKAAVAIAAEVKPLTWQGLSEEQIKNFKSVGPWELFGNGEAGVRWDASWNVPGWITNNTFKWDFVGIPGGTQELVYDAIVVSATTADVKEAYEFAKWMSFSPVAYAKEVELAKAANSAPKMPVSVDTASIELYKTFVDKPGILAALANLDNSLVESLQKSVPGYADARWNGKPGIDIGEDKDVTIGWMMDNSYSGKFKFEDYSAQLEEFANNILTTAAAEMPK
jgi:hypothetical protein